MILLRSAAALLLALAPMAAADKELLGAIEVVDKPLAKPVCAVWAPGDRSRMFVCEQHKGRIRIVKDGVLQSEPFLTIPVASDQQERGLLNLVFDPDYQTNGYFYVYFANPDAHNVLARFRRAGANPDLADPASRRELFLINRSKPSGGAYEVHYGSFLGFNPLDASDPAKRHWLYVSNGDTSASQSDNGQKLDTLFGKILRIDVDPATYGGAGQLAYGIPSANTPIAAGARPEIIAVGVRNPWRGSFDRATGDLWFGDVGPGDEEVNRLPHGAVGYNFQWNTKIAGDVLKPDKFPSIPGVSTDAIHYWKGGAIIGGVRYRGNALPGWRGTYFFGNYGGDVLRSFTPSGDLRGFSDLNTKVADDIFANSALPRAIGKIVSFGEDLDGEMYVCEHGNDSDAGTGKVFKIIKGSLRKAPTFTSIPPTTAQNAVAYSYQARVDGNPASTFTLNTKPTGMTIVGSTGVVSWTPTTAQTGAFAVRITAANGIAPNAVQDFTVTVSAQRPPEFPLSSPAITGGGLDYRYYELASASFPDLTTRVPTATGIAASATLGAVPGRRADDFALRFAGYVRVEVAGSYTFSTASDDGSMVLIGDRVVVNNNGTAGVTATPTIALAVGWHRLTVLYQEKQGGEQLNVSWLTPGAGSAVPIPSASVGRDPYGLSEHPGIAAYLGTLPATAGGAMPATLSATGVFADTPAMRVAAGLIPYDVNTPLWSDGASKLRWLAIPTGRKIGFSADGNWLLPAGSVLVKHFDLGAKRLETRLLVVTASGAYGVTYKWRADHSDADLLPGDQPLAEVVGSQTWTYPSRANCMQCHTPEAGFALGTRTRQLHRDHRYPLTGKTDNQIRTLGALGLLDAAYREEDIAGYVRTVAIGDTTATLEQRARSYLDANCMMCHQPGGVQATFDARFSTPLASQGLVGGAVHNDLGIAGGKVVVGGDPGRSILHARIDTTDPAIRMPIIGRSVVDSEARDVIAAWIRSLPVAINAAPTVVLVAAPTPVAGSTATVSGTVGDDGLPTGSVLAIAWSQVSGPAAAVFAAPSAASTSVTFPVAGTWVLRLSAGDGALTTARDLSVTVSAAPIAGTVQVDFAPAGSAAMEGWLLDAGAAFADRGNGQTYGWSVANTTGRNRNSATAPDEMRDTFLETSGGGVAKAWEIALANGAYDIDLYCGDPSYTDSLNHLVVEGAAVRDPDGNDNYDQYALTATVADGRLTIAPAADGAKPKLCGIRIRPQGGAANAGPSVVLGAAPAATAGAPVQLTATVTDDGLPAGSTMTVVWTQVSGPGAAVIAAPASTTTQATFPTAGTWVLRLSASDGSLTTTQDLTIVVASAPSGGTPIQVDFGPVGSAPQAGWLSDTGAVFGDRGNGHSYGWSVLANLGRERNSANAPDQMHDTFLETSNGGILRTWEIEVPNGIYEIDLSCGDPSYTDSINHLVVEGVPLRDADGEDHFDDFPPVPVTVSDGRLTIAPSVDGKKPKLAGVRLVIVPTGSN